MNSRVTVRDATKVASHRGVQQVVTCSKIGAFGPRLLLLSKLGAKSSVIL
jgi:hypothetical protein